MVKGLHLKTGHVDALISVSCNFFTPKVYHVLCGSLTREKRRN